MAEIKGLVRALRSGDDAAKTAAARTLCNLAFQDYNRDLIRYAGGVPPLVELVRDGSAEAKFEAAWALSILARNNAANKVAIAAAGGIAPLVELLRDGSAEAKRQAARALGNLAADNAANRVLIAEAGGIPPLVQLVRDGSADARMCMRNLARNNVANAVAIAAAVGFEALVQLARFGRVTVDNWLIVSDAGVPAKRKAALVVAALPDSVPRENKDIIASYL
ncbi:hypothetical protein SO694_00046264 [Aureococcus anophagefferens]|uniref:Armadillo repeat-containing domain-containing protein n=1 Tax=Aureococcus anophagefferens TaxID=44056 RepID=A0ABR1G8G8_AURAN